MNVRRVALVSGAGRGIGQATAIELSRRGYSVALVARTPSDLRETAGQVADSQILPADVSQSDSVADAVGKCAERFGRIDALIHCAGVAPVLEIEKTTDRQWHEVIDTNLSAAFYLARAVWPIFKRQQGGAIVNISSLAARDPFPGLGIYGAAKAGINLLGLSLAREGAPFGISVHTIAPGAVETAMLRKLLSREQLSPDKTLDPAEVAIIAAQCITGELKQTSGEVIWVHKTV